jgi:hypothetical protein
MATGHDSAQEWLICNLNCSTPAIPPHTHTRQVACLAQSRSRAVNDAGPDLSASTRRYLRGRWVRVRALPGRAERRVLHAEADSAAEALIFPPDGGQARASGRNRPNVPCSDIADVGSAEFNVCLWRRQSTVLLSQRDRSICSWWPAPLAVAEGASATDPADRPERRCEAISSAARRTWRISSS